MQHRQTLQMLLTADDLSNAGTATLSIRTTSLPDSEPATAVIRPAGPNPIAHLGTLANQGAQLLISGSNFVTGAHVRRNGKPLPTTFVNPFVLVASLDSEDLRVGGDDRRGESGSGRIESDNHGDVGALVFAICAAVIEVTRIRHIHLRQA